MEALGAAGLGGILTLGLAQLLRKLDSLVAGQPSEREMVTIKFNLGAATESRKRSRSVDTYQGNEEDQESVITDGSEVESLPQPNLPPAVAVAGRTSPVALQYDSALNGVQQQRKEVEADRERKHEQKI